MVVTGRVINLFTDEEGFVRADVSVGRGEKFGLKVCGRPPQIGEEVAVIDDSLVLTTTRAPETAGTLPGADSLASNPEGSAVTANPFGVLATSGDLTYLLITWLGDLIKMVSRELAIHNDAFSLETFYKDKGISALRLAGSCNTDLNRSEVYDWFFIVEDDTIKIEKWDSTEDKTDEEKNEDRKKRRGAIYVKKDEIVIEVIDETDPENVKFARLQLKPDFAELSVSGAKITLNGQDITISADKFVTIKGEKIFLN